MKNLQKGLQDIKKKLDGKVPLNKLFDNDFMKSYTKCATLEDFYDKGNLTDDDFENNNIDKIEKAVEELTKFKSWEEMKQVAGTRHFKKELKKMGIPVQ